MAQTNAIWDPLEYTLDQIARHKIPIEQICRAVKREHRTAVKEYLAGKSPCKHFKIGGTILSIVQDIVDARMSEQRQVEEPRELHCAPRHPGIPGRECTILRLSRGRFLELCRLSQPELVDALGEETAKANDEENSGEENDIEPDLDIREWPRLNPPALRGIAKEFVELATRSSEADPAAVLVIFLSRFGIEIGTDPHIMIGDKRHSARLFAVIVGSSSKARKGTSADPVRRLFEFDLLRVEADEGFFYDPARISPGPISSREGLIYAVRDPEKNENAGAGDKRLFVQDEEFAAALKSMMRKGNVLSTIIRTAFDHGNLEPLTKHDRIKATGAHLGIVTHTTLAELSRLLSHSDVFGGFANRFLWVCSRRQQEVPLPLPMPENELEVLQRRLLTIITTVQKFGAIEMSEAATKRWCAIYPQLSAERSGLGGAATNRAEAYTRRLALTYALLDEKSVIELEHLEAALAVWQHAEDSAQYIFGGKMEDPVAQKILDALESAPERSMSLTEIHKLLSRHVRKEQMEMAINEAVASGKVEVGREKTRGRPRKILRLVKKAK